MSDELRRHATQADGVQEIVNSVGLAAISTVPVVGPIVSELAQGSLNHRETIRQQRFDALVIDALEAHGEAIEAFSAESILDSEEFLAAYAKASRVAAETASETKRRYLARALAQMGPWNSIDVSRKQLLLDLVGRYEELHVRLLDYFRDPVAWIRRGTPDFAIDSVGMGSVSGPLGNYMFPGVPEWASTVVPAIKTLENDSTASIPWSTMMSTQGILEPRILPLGSALLGFIGVESGSTNPV